MEGLRDSIKAYRRMGSGDAKSRLGSSLLDEAAELAKQAGKAEQWLARNWDRGDDEEYIETLRDYESVCDLRDEIREVVLG